MQEAKITLSILFYFWAEHTFYKLKYELIYNVFSFFVLLLFLGLLLQHVEVPRLGV